MADELVYVDIGEEDSPYYELKIDSVQYADLARRGMITCGRKGTKFSSIGEKKKWEAIANKIKKNEIPIAWVEICLAWAAKRNKQKTHIVFSGLLSLITNKTKMEENMATLGKKKVNAYKKPDNMAPVGESDTSDFLRQRAKQSGSTDTKDALRKMAASQDE